MTMRLSSTPKPVKVRIVSGGRDHSSLESLRQYFNLDDLAKNEAQVLRWLNTLGEEGKAIVKQLKEKELCFDTPDPDKVFAIYSLFFKQLFEQQKIANADGLMAFWQEPRSAYHDNYKALLITMAVRCHCAEAAIAAIRSDLDLGDDVMRTIAAMEDANAQYSLFEFYQKKGLTNEAEIHLKNAERLHHSEAIKKAKSLYRPIINDYKKKVKNNVNLMQSIFDGNYDWARGANIELFFDALREEGIDIRLLDKDLIDVYFTGCCIIKKNSTEKEKVEEAEQTFGIKLESKIKPKDWRERRGLFVISLLSRWAGNRRYGDLLAKLTDYNLLCFFLYKNLQFQVRNSWTDYTDTRSFKANFPKDDVRNFLEYHKSCVDVFKDLGLNFALEGKDLTELFNLYFMNTDILEDSSKV